MSERLLAAAAAWSKGAAAVLVPSMVALVVLLPDDALQAARAAETRASAGLVTQKLDLLDNLLRSGATRRIEREGDQRARELLASARGLAVEARDALAEGNAEVAGKLADQALKATSRARKRLRSAAPAAPAAQHEAAARYEQMRVAVSGYREALAVTSAGSAGSGYGVAALDAELATAAELAGAGHPGKAADSLAAAYQSTITALADLRRNETVVHALVFETPAEEFAYERERFRGNELLLEMMLERGGAAPATVGLARRYAESARESQRRALELARAGDHGAGIAELEKASRRLGRALAVLGLPAGF